MSKEKSCFLSSFHTHILKLHRRLQSVQQDVAPRNKGQEVWFSHSLHFLVSIFFKPIWFQSILSHCTDFGALWKEVTPPPSLLAVVCERACARVTCHREVRLCCFFFPPQTEKLLCDGARCHSDALVVTMMMMMMMIYDMMVYLLLMPNRVELQTTRPDQQRDYQPH